MSDKALESRPWRRGKGARAFPKGRQVSPEAHNAVRAALGALPRRRDLLIEHLHVLNDRYGHLSVAHLAALAEEMRLSQAEVYEVATFYAHFDVVAEDESPPPPLTIRVCCSLPCAIAGAEALGQALAESVDNSEVRVLRAPCMGRCHAAPVCEVGHRHVDHADVSAVRAVVEGGAYRPHIPDYKTLETYRAEGGYRLLAACREGARAVDEVIATLDAAGLRGLGGAGFPLAQKWRIVRGYGGPRLMTVNADEGEPGTFKDRYWLERDPHRFLEGALIAAWAVEAERCYIYLRDEYPAVREILRRELKALEEAGIVAPDFMILRRGAGAYICGEESAMIESIEGKRGLPRHRPPYIAEVGLFGRPTLNHNVETLVWIRDILEKGADWFARQGVNGAKGLRSYSVSGRVKRPGVVVAPAGSTVRDLIVRAGGMLDGHTFRAYLPGGASGGILPAVMDDIPLDFGRLEAHGCFIGSHAVIVLSDKDDLKSAVHNLMAFFAEESCGQCTPCRVGCEKARMLLEEARPDTALLAELAETMADASICGLGQAAPNPLLCLMRYFPEALDGS